MRANGLRYAAVVEPSGFEPHVHCGHQTGHGASADYVDMLVGIAKHVDLRLLHLSANVRDCGKQLAKPIKGGMAITSRPSADSSRAALVVNPRRSATCSSTLSIKIESYWPRVSTERYPCSIASPRFRALRASTAFGPIPVERQPLFPATSTAYPIPGADVEEPGRRHLRFKEAEHALAATPHGWRGPPSEKNALQARHRRSQTSTRKLYVS